MHARAIHNALTQSRTVQKGWSNPPNPPQITPTFRRRPFGRRPVRYSAVESGNNEKRDLTEVEAWFTLQKDTMNYL